MITVTNKSVDKLTLNYGYLYQINRVFGDRHPQGDWESNSHVLNASYTVLDSALASHLQMRIRHHRQQRDLREERDLAARRRRE